MPSGERDRIGGTLSPSRDRIGADYLKVNGDGSSGTRIVRFSRQRAQMHDHCGTRGDQRRIVGAQRNQTVEQLNPIVQRDCQRIGQALLGSLLHHDESGNAGDKRY